MSDRRWSRIVLAALLLPLATTAAAVLANAEAAQASCSHIASDFNGDGNADIAIGSPLRSSSAHRDVGAVQIAYGSSTGIKTSHSQFFSDASFSQITPAENDMFGAEVMPGNFNGDCYGDLAIAVPSAIQIDDARPATGVHNHGGAVVVLYGSASGLTTTHEQVFLADALDPSAKTIRMSLAVGDFNKDKDSDLAIGLPGGGNGAGSVAVLLGSSGGLGTTQLFTQDTPGVPGVSEGGDQFGGALAAGDFTGDGYSDLAIGAPGEGYGAVDAAGAVTVLKGFSGGLTASGSKMWTEDTTGVPGVGESGDGFGATLAARDITGDGKSDLAIGAPTEGIGSHTEAGAVTILQGSATSILTTSHAQLFDQDTSGVPGSASSEDMFGAALAYGDFNGDGHGDLAIGDSEESISGHIEAGTVTVLDGKSTGLTTSGAKLWDQNTTGVLGTAEGADEFGFALTTLHIRSGTYSDLVIGDPGESLGANLGCGAVAIIDGGTHGLTATGNQLIDPADLSGGAHAEAQAGASVG